MTSIGDVLRSHKGVGPGFDMLRIGLAMGVLCLHSYQVVFGSNLGEDHFVLLPIYYCVVPMFFGLSGFLITASAMRLSLKNFILNRSMRIVPALAVDVLISALFLGPLLTNLNLRDYLLDSKFARYLLNIFGYIHYQLPSVFPDTPVPYIVNGSLWTVVSQFEI